MLRSIQLVTSTRNHELTSGEIAFPWPRKLVKLWSRAVNSSRVRATRVLHFVIKYGGRWWYWRCVSSYKSIFFQYFNKIRQYFGGLTTYQIAVIECINRNISCKALLRNKQWWRNWRSLENVGFICKSWTRDFHLVITSSAVECNAAKILFIPVNTC